MPTGSRVSVPDTKQRKSEPQILRLAHAGFYYNPTSSNPDNVTCYLCKSNLDGWEETDNAVDEHISHCQDCGWAINIWIEQAIEKGASDLENPLSEKMLEARKMTFSTGWPHEDKRGWLCKTQKMSEAGWHYAPTPESDDFVKCSYCSLSLDGWEPKDKPYQEHERRSPECLFFKLAGSVKPKAVGRSKKERVSKASRLSTQSNLTVASEAPSFADVEVGGDDSLLSTATTTTSKSIKKAKGSKTSKKAPGSKKSAVKVVEEPTTLASSYMEPEDDDFSVKVDFSPQAKPKGRKRPSHQISTDQENGLDRENEDGKATPAKRRATRTRNSGLQTREPPNTIQVDSQDVQMDQVDSTILKAIAAPATKKGRKGGKKQGSTKSRKTSNMSTASKASLRTAILDDDEVDAALELDLDRPLTDDEDDVEPQTRQSKGRRLTKTRPGKASVAPTRRATRASTAPVDVSILGQGRNPPQVADVAETDVEDLVEEIQHSRSQTSQPKKTKRAKQQISVKSGESMDMDEENLDNELLRESLVNAKAGVASKKASRVRQASRQKPAVSTPETAPPIDAVAASAIDVGLIVDQTLMDDSGHETDASVATQSRATRKKPVAKKGRKGKKSQIPHQNLEDIVHTDKIEVDLEATQVSGPAASCQEQNTGPAVKAPAKTKKGKKAAKISSPPPQLTREDPASPTDLKELTPMPSPQSSDAENHPPSSRPSATRPPLSSVSSPPLPTTRIPLVDVTPVRSPSKHTFSKLQTAVPWTAVDLELIFQATPIEDKEIVALGFNVKNAANAMCSPEKKMSVEQWIQFCAQRGEERLRTDCERIVGKFESEGMRALNTLEGIACAE